MTLADFARKIAALGVPGVVFIVAMSTTGLAGGAAITTALALLGGPAGMYGGIALLPIISVAADYLAKYGIEYIIALIYQKRIDENGETVEAVVREISDLKIISDSTKQNVINRIYQVFSFMLVGRTGVGKSSTINSLMGVRIAEVGDSEPTTFSVEPYSLTKNGVSFTIWDTPGLCDALDNANDQTYINQIKERIEDVDCLWFVTRLDETRLSSDEQYALLLITSSLGSQIWRNALIVFTHACSNSIQGRFEEALRERTSIISEYIKSITSEEYRTLPSVAVDNTTDLLPNGDEWLPELFTKVIEEASNKGSIAFGGSLGDDTRERSGSSGPRINLSSQQKKRVELRLRGLLTAAAAGALTGGIFGPGGAVVGGIVGSTLAFWKAVRR